MRRGRGEEGTRRDGYNESTYFVDERSVAPERYDNEQL